MFENIKKLLSVGEERGIPASQISVFQNGKEIYSAWRGQRDESGTQVTGDELYNIYSCTKFITCTAALLLLEEGKFSLDDDIADYIPEFGDMKVKKESGIYKAENRIKIHHLFTMTSGLDYALKSPEILEGKAETEGRCPTVEMMKYIAKMPLEFEPGERWHYGLSHDVIAALIEIVSGKRFGLYIKEKILDPLGMTETTFCLPDEKLDRLCDQYRYSKKETRYRNIGKRTNAYRFGPEYESGGAGLVSTVKEYMLFLEAMRKGQILLPETQEMMRKNYLNEQQRRKYWMPAGYGYGLGIRVPLGDGRRTDYGWAGAAGAFMAIDPEHDLTLYYSQHVHNSPFAPIRKDCIEAIKLDLGYEAFVEDMYNGKGQNLA